jgi:BlaI family transcriptional regulator, penicillinase repressor
VSPSPRRSLLDLAPLELDCLNTLWPMGEGTVREIRDALAARRPRAYTTIMTIMDRLARKGVVERRKAGRAYIYRANLSAEQARSQAIGQVIENFFAGSKDALLSHLGGHSSAPAHGVTSDTPRVYAAAASASSSAPQLPSVATVSALRDDAVKAAVSDAAENIDATLL